MICFLARLPNMYATPKAKTIPAIIAGIIGTNTSSVVSYSEEIARAVGPPQGNIFITPMDSSASVDNVYKLMPIFL